jgi:murein DD-endopeptidase MepM/ murein hydrolase activator NlpD
MKTTFKARIAAFACMLLLFAAHAEDIVHVLQRGETLYAISRRYKVSADAIMSFNNISNPDRLKAGQKLLIPGVYTVKKGDTLYGIARKLSLPVSDLTKANNLSESSVIKPGDSLFIPGGPQAAAAAERPRPKPEAPVVALEEAEIEAKPLTDPRTFTRRSVDTTIIWPVSPREIAYLSGKLYGVSIIADKGASVKVISSGTVLSTGPYRGFGQVAFVQASSGHIYVYGGLGSCSVKPGESVTFGDQLGTIGQDTLSGKPQLYFMVYNKDKPIDPAKAPRGH